METAATWLSLARDVLTTAAALLALLGISAWRRDFLGKREIELAEDTLNLFYQARDAIKAMRSPLAFSNESEGVEPNDRESPETLHWRQTVAPMHKRYNDRVELFAQLQSTRYRFMARFGNAAAQPFEELRMIVHECFIAARMLVDTAADAAVLGDIQEMGDAARRLRESRRRWESVLWDMGADDAINLRLNATVQSMETACRAIIDRKHFLGRLLKSVRIWWYAPVGRRP